MIFEYTKRKQLTVASFGAAVFASSLNAQVIEVEYNSPTMDRWNYPFNGAPGTRLSASTFGAIELDGFDDHDAQLLLGFETFAEIPLGLDPSEYQILSATITITSTNDEEFRYDPTYDTHDTYEFLDESLDTDLGRPTHLWAVGYRNGFDQTTFGEFSAFGGTPSVEPTQESRHAFAAYFPDGVTATDVSNNLKQEFDATPMAIGQTDSVAPGEFVPTDAQFTFEVNLCDPAVRGYLNDSLALGDLRFVVSSLHTANGGDGGGTGDITYPFWYTRENPIAQLFGFAPKLQLRVRVGSPADYNGDGSLNFFDVSEFLSDFSAGNTDADLNSDCTLNFFDISTFLSAFSG
ncbi:MAG: GC-type dockerin domain-anchored protein [Phycisphaerales bacterium]|nr:GC-type dockerin domain-anchored protein [Phycisphaerales bacterium]